MHQVSLTYPRPHSSGALGITYLRGIRKRGGRRGGGRGGNGGRGGGPGGRGAEPQLLQHLGVVPGMDVVEDAATRQLHLPAEEGTAEGG